MSDITNKVITLEYNLHRDTVEGELVDTTEGKSPLVFLSGLGHMIPEFEGNVVDLLPGDTFAFSILSENAYGPKREEAVMDLPHDMFMNEGKMVEEVIVGNMLPLQDDQGRVIPGKVLSINDTTVTFDLNHPLAEQDLYFTGRIVDVRLATAEELEHGHAHEPGGEEQ